MKKLMAVATALVLTAALAISGTSAFLLDTDSNVNVMTTGNVRIEQHEQERRPLSTRSTGSVLTGFTQGKPAFPAVGPVEWAENGVTLNGAEYKMFTDKLHNVIDKIVTVENTGWSGAYIRTIVAIEAPGGNPDNLIHVNINEDGLTFSGFEPVEINDTEYSFAVFTYDAALSPKTTSPPSLLQIFLDAKTGNEFCEALGDTWDILVLSQATQSAGFADAKTALDTAFGACSAANIADWFKDSTVPIILSSYDSFKDARGSDGSYVIGSDFAADNILFFGNGTNAALDLNGKTITAENKNQFAFGAQNGGCLVLTGSGTVNMGKGFMVNKGNAQITIHNGTYNATVAASTDKTGKYHSIIQNNASMVIHDGTFTSNTEDAALFLATSNAILEINGGFFENTADKTPDLLDVGLNKSNTNRIIIKGGTFVNYNPLDDPDCYNGEWPDSYEQFSGPFILVWDGYKVVSEPQSNGDVWYTVVDK